MKEVAIIRDKIENYFLSLTWRDETEKIISFFWDENEIEYCDYLVSRQDRERENHFSWSSKKKMKLTLTRIPGIENSY